MNEKNIAINLKLQHRILQFLIVFCLQSDFKYMIKLYKTFIKLFPSFNNSSHTRFNERTKCDFDLMPDTNSIETEGRLLSFYFHF
jgi:hypothetical protein